MTDDIGADPAGALPGAPLYGLTDGPAPASRLARVRAALRAQTLAGFIVPHADAYQGEAIAPEAERLWWLTGFSGSAGLAVIGLQRAALFVDGRYALQARDQTDAALVAIHHLRPDAIAAWIEEGFGAGDIIGVDPWLHSLSGLRRLEAAVARAGATLRPLEDNPIDALWTERPPALAMPPQPHPLRYTGETAADKRARLAADLRRRSLDAAMLTAGDAIAWLLNIRGGDIATTPVPQGYALLRADATLELFLDPRRRTPALQAHLGPQVRLWPEAALAEQLRVPSWAGQRVLADTASCPARVMTVLRESGAEVEEGADPCALPRALKNQVEIAGMRAAHRRDGVALTATLAWLAEVVPLRATRELDVVARARALRAESPLFRGDSFETIAGFGPNGAVIHYRPTARSNRLLEPGSLLLLDSGAQYLDGTTDVTRTIAIGSPSAAMRETFTLVLKGHIALARARFPAGLSGARLDPLARAPLWSRGLDYLHGTGHGVGSYLNVHEGPHGISPRNDGVVLRPGMVVTNEPGYYEEGAYGIRIETVMVVCQVGAGATPIYGFETLTLAPIDRALIDGTLLDAAERDWLDRYHARVWDEIAPLSSAAVRAWLCSATAPLP